MLFSKQLVGSICILLLAFQGVSAQTPLASPSLVQQEVIEVSGITTDAQIYGLTNAQKKTTHRFFDGLGRNIQINAVQASPLQNDIIKFSEYNNLGQELYNFLPYNPGTNTGVYHSSAPTEQTSYYSNGLQDKVIDDPDPWSENVVESSPLQRTYDVGMDGSGFQPVSGQNYKTVNYRVNNSSVYPNDNDYYSIGIRMWSSTGTSSGAYPTGSLSVTEYTDESGNVTLFYKDATGRLILKRKVVATQVINNNYENRFDTYYVYDDAGELLYMIPPKATSTIRRANTSPWNITSASSMIYSYVYDAMGRVIEKQLPGADWFYYVYDPMNRVVLMQDGNLRANSTNKWAYFKYDIKGRIVSKGIYVDAVNGTSLTSMQSYVSGLSGTVYATYYYEEKQAGGTSPNYYTNRIFPTTNQNGSALQVLAYTYFDNYDFNDDGVPDFSYTVQGITDEGTATALMRGLKTGEYTQTFNNDGTLSVWLHKVPFYDKRGNLIQVLSNSHVNTAAADTKTNGVDFMGKPIQQKMVQSVNGVTTTALLTIGYDNYNRLSTVDQSNNGATAVRVAAYVYNEIGQMVTRRLHSTDDVNFMQNVDYRYNINGLLTSINNATLTVDNTNYTNSDANDIFGEEILYDKTDATGLGNTPQYNGNISGVKWKDLPPSPGNNNERSYIYAYDQLNRLTTAHYAEWSSGSSNWSQAVGYSDENVTSYDQNGNILALNRYSLNTEIDNLTYQYVGAGDQCTNITDWTNNPAGFNGTNASSYAYDKNGNLSSDPYKGTTLYYNVLGKIDKVQFNASGNYIRYTYDASGSVLRKDVYTKSTGATVTYDYVNGFVYQGLVLSYFPTTEGRVRNNSGTLTFEYFIRDHLGNVRVSFDGTGGSAVVRQENSYYPFGMNLAGNYTPSQPNNHLYNGGNEWQNDYGNYPDYYQTAGRDYDPEIGRFISMDPKAGQFADMNSYEFAGDNPIAYNDPDGMQTIYLGGGTLYNVQTGETYDNGSMMLSIQEGNGGAQMVNLYSSDGSGLTTNAFTALVMVAIVAGQDVTIDANFVLKYFQASFTNYDGPQNSPVVGVTQSGDGWDVFYISNQDSKTKSFNVSTSWLQGMVTDLRNLFNDKPDFWDYFKQGLSIAAGIVEIATASAVPWAAPFLVADGALRIGAAVSKIGALAMDGKKAAEELPSNAGGMIAAMIQGRLGSNMQQNWQNANDALSLIFGADEGIIGDFNLGEFGAAVRSTTIAAGLGHLITGMSDVNSLADAADQLQNE